MSTTRRDSLLVCLSREKAAAKQLMAAEVGRADIDILTPSEFRGRPLRRYGHVGVAGSPPADEIGFALAVAIATLARANRITLVDTERRQTRSRSRSRFLASELAPAMAQLGVSAAAVLLQRTFASVPLKAAERRSRDPHLRRLLYLRPLVGTGDRVGGSVTHSHEVIRALHDRGISIQPFTTDRWIAEVDRPTDDWSWRLVHVPRPFKAIPASAAIGGDLALALHSLPAARGTDVIYQRHSRFSLAGALLSHVTRRPLFLEYNGPETFFGEQWQPTPLQGQLAACETAALKASTRVIVVSAADRDSLLERGLDAGRIVVNPNAVDASRFMRGGGEDLRRQLSLAPEQFVVGFVGSFGRWHGAPVLARAFVRLAAALPEARLLLVGAGEEHETVRRTIEKGGVADKVVFAGRVPSAEVPRYLDACDALASPHVQLPGGTRFFGSPTKLFEYMAAGKAIAASRLEQIDEVLEHERSALLVAPGDADGLAQALLRLARDSDLRARLGGEARRNAAERHTWRENAERIVRAYEELPA